MIAVVQGGGSLGAQWSCGRLLLVVAAEAELKKPEEPEGGESLTLSLLAARQSNSEQIHLPDRRNGDQIVKGYSSGHRDYGILNSGRIIAISHAFCYLWGPYLVTVSRTNGRKPIIQ